MLEYLHSLKNYTDFKYDFEIMSEGDKKSKGIKILNIVDNVLNFTLENGKQQGLGLKILTPNQMLSRLPITLA